MTDPLTKLPNRGSFFDRLSRELERGPASVPRPLTICLCDVDRFKQVNHSYGIRAGDDVLIALGGIINEEIGPSDFTARVGGDEFSICFPFTGIDDACQSVERIRRRIETTSFERNGKSFPVSVSFGLAQWRPEFDIDTLMEAADQALYRAKNQARNRTAEIIPIDSFAISRNRPAI